MPTFYYLCPYRLRLGSIVEPGNWGRILRLYTPTNPKRWLVEKENIYEEIRAAGFADRPSRLTSAFVCETLAYLRDFQTQTGREFDLPYRVELADPNPSNHRSCISLVDNQAGDTPAIWRERAERYWRGDQIQRPEIITSSGLRLVEGPL